MTDFYLQGTANATSKDIQNTEEYKCRPIEKDILNCMLKNISKNDNILGKMVVTADQIELKGDNVYKCPVSCFFVRRRINGHKLQIFIAINFIKEQKVTKSKWRQFVEGHIKSLQA